ncbi:MAG: YjbH domain-containing protein [Alphaproteobacteria bacterium]|nr:YjbH domain-containing protein [Alphaproteobacteria bacterium]
MSERFVTLRQLVRTDIVRLAFWMLWAGFTLSVWPDFGYAGEHSSVALQKPRGLNTVPDARMDPAGTVRFDVATLDPYVHAALSVQLADSLAIGLRQTMEVSSINGDPDRLYPGIDAKIRINRESRYVPSVSLGILSALGHKRMAGEYLVASKRWKDFDLTAGMGWGRAGSAGHLKNPLRFLGSHFDKKRPLDGEGPNGPDDWFTGEQIGFFGGIAYETPWDGLSLKADWNADRYRAEQDAFDYNAPAPWSLGFDYMPYPGISAGAALVGGDKLMGRLRLQSPVTAWPGRYEKKTTPPILRPYRTNEAAPGAIDIAASREGIALYDTRLDTYVATTHLAARSEASSLPHQIGRAARHMTNHAGKTVEALDVVPTIYGLHGPSIRLLRRDIEAALARNQGSPQELWRGMQFGPVREAPETVALYRYQPGLNPPGWRLRLILDNQLSLSEEDSGVLYRTSLIAEERKHLTPHIVTGGALRLNIGDNLGRIHDIRPRTALPVRGDVDRFAQATVTVDRLYAGWLKTVKPDLHLAVTGGHLEEMYSGLGGEILWRPFQKRFALGAEAYQVFKRDPATALALGPNGDHVLTGHLQGWYEIPETDLTLQMRAGRYLAEDVGGTLALERRFDNGARLTGFVTATDAADFDLFGGTTYVYSGLRWTLPLGNVKYLPPGSEIRVSAVPQGRNAGQALDPPLPLYDLTEPLSYRHIVRHWREVVE